MMHREGERNNVSATRGPFKLRTGPPGVVLKLFWRPNFMICIDVWETSLGSIEFMGWLVLVRFFLDRICVGVAVSVGVLCQKACRWLCLNNCFLVEFLYRTLLFLSRPFTHWRIFSIWEGVSVWGSGPLAVCFGMGFLTCALLAIWVCTKSLPERFSWLLDFVPAYQSRSQIDECAFLLKVRIVQFI